MGNDVPELDVWGLVYPFVVCKSHGGPYDDAAFAAGWQAGQVNERLRRAELAEMSPVTVQVLTALVDQLVLVGMDHGYPLTHVDTYETVPEWSTVTFERGSDL